VPNVRGAVPLDLDPILPSQQPRRDQTRPEARLACAMLERALRDCGLMQRIRRDIPCVPEDVHEARAWLLGGLESSARITLAHACGLIGVDPEAVSDACRARFATMPEPPPIPTPAVRSLLQAGKHQRYLKRMEDPAYAARRREVQNRKNAARRGERLKHRDAT
jgi:hypothetical protein